MISDGTVNFGSLKMWVDSRFSTEARRARHVISLFRFTSMEVGGVVETSMEVGGSRFTSMEVSGSFHGNTWKFPPSVEV